MHMGMVNVEGSSEEKKRIRSRYMYIPRGERREETGKYCGGKNETQNRNQRVGRGQQDILFIKHNYIKENNFNFKKYTK